MGKISKEEVERIESLLPTKKFCPAPFLHSYINANNRAFKFCCMSHIIGRWDITESLKEQADGFWEGDVYQSARTQFLNGEMPDACEWWCGKIESEGLFDKSDRLNFIRKFERVYGDKFYEFSWDIEKGTREFQKPVDIDLRSSKLCNLKCRSCNSIWSSEIEKEVIENPEIQKWSHWDTVTQSPASLARAKQIDWTDPNFDVTKNLDFENVKYLAMSGGESLIDPRVYNILKKIVDDGYASEMSLHLITNCTSLPTRIFELIVQFNEVTINISIDGIGELDDFLRDGQTWERKVQVFHRIFELPNLRWATINHTFQVLNAFQIKQNVEWFVEQNRRYEKLDHVNFNPIVDPWYLSVTWLDDDHKDYIRKQIQECIEEFDMSESEQNWFGFAHSQLDKSQDDRNQRYANDFVRANLALDKIRKQDTVSVEPMLKRYFDRYDPSNITITTAGKPGAQFDGKPKPTARHKK